MAVAPPKNKHASALGRLARGKPKNFSAAERKRRRQRMREINARRITPNGRI
jgi:hypothetical protein